MRTHCAGAKIERQMKLLHGRGRSSFTPWGRTGFTPGSEARSPKGPFLSSILKYQIRYSAACTASLAGARSRASWREDRKGGLRTGNSDRDTRGSTRQLNGTVLQSQESNGSRTMRRITRGASPLTT